jgi:hypothetical protein
LTLNAQKSLKDTWISTKDKKYSMVFEDSTWIDKYEDKIIATHYYYIIKDTLFSFNILGSVPLKYKILGVSKKDLTLLELWRGELIFFRRK